MKYKVLIAQLDKITTPVTACFDGQRKEFANGLALAAFEFDKNYLVERISVENGRIHIDLIENQKMNTTNWVGEEEVGFF